MKVGFIGLGQMGEPMARHIMNAGHELVVYDNRREACDPLAQEGAEIAATAADVAKRSEAVVTAVPWPGRVDEVMLAPDGILAGAGAGLLVIDTTVMPPKHNREMARRCNELGIDYVDAPVSGSRPGAIAGTLGVMVGGDDAVFARAQPILECVGSKVRHVGAVGYGNALKLLNQCIFISYMSAFSEGLALGEDMGFSLDTMLDVFESSSAGHWVMTYKYDEIKGNIDRPGFLVHRARMFIELAREACEEITHATPVFDTVIENLKRAEEQGFGNEDVILAREAYLKLRA